MLYDIFFDTLSLTRPNEHHQYMRNFTFLAQWANSYKPRKKNKFLDNKTKPKNKMNAI